MIHKIRSRKDKRNWCSLKGGNGSFHWKNCTCYFCFKKAINDKRVDETTRIKAENSLEMLNRKNKLKIQGEKNGQRK